MMLDFIEQNPNLDEEDRQAGIVMLAETQAELTQALRNGVDAGGLVYVRHFLDFNDLVLDMFQQAPFDTASSQDQIVWRALKARQNALDARGLQIVASNPTSSFFKMLFTGVPKVKPID